MSQTLSTPSTLQSETYLPEPTTPPRFWVEESPEATLISIEIPGASKEQTQIDLHEGLLSVRATRTLGTPPEAKVHLRELTAHPYQLRLRLSADLNPQTMTASLSHGILAIRIPLREAALPRRIEVQG